MCATANPQEIEKTGLYVLLDKRGDILLASHARLKGMRWDPSRITSDTLRTR